MPDRLILFGSYAGRPVPGAPRSRPA